jgi:replicative DNA helicase
MDAIEPGNGASLRHAEAASAAQTGTLASPAIGNGARSGMAPPVMPHNLEAEQAVLGALLLNNDVFEQASEVLEPGHFFEPLHQRLFEKVSELIRKGRVASPITVKSVMGEDAALKEVGGQSYLANLAGAAFAVVSPHDYARVVRDLALRRELIRIAEGVRDTAFNDAVGLSPHDQIERAETHLFDLAESGKAERGFEHFRSALKKATDMAAGAYRKSAGVAGLGTGLLDLDQKLGGLFPSDLVILAGRPGMGKTALATNIAFNVARNHRLERDSSGEERLADGGIVAFYSLEMSEEQLALRILSEQTEIRSERIRKGQITEDDFRKLVAVSAELEHMPLYIDATGAIPISTLATRARRLKRKIGLDLIVIDYIQLMAPSGRKRYDSRVQEVSEITQGLKALAKELNVPILALSQLSRAVEQRERKRPVLADLRESGSIEQDADIVMFIYREDYYLESQRPPEESADFDRWRAQIEPVHGIAEILVEKHRHGPTGSVSLHFAREFTRFSNLERPGYDVR